MTPLYGKLGDIYGRKVVLQAAIVIFLIGSALCGVAHRMVELIMFRAIQGLGGGGLMVTAQATVGDIVPPRERGRYQGLFGAVFGVATVVGPLMGGFFVEQLSWRWIFYVNIPLGILALGVIAVALRAPASRRAHVDRLPRAPRCSPARCLPRAGHQPGRHHLPLVVAADPGPARRSASSWPARSCWSRAGRPSRCCRSSCSETGCSPWPA